MKKHRPVGKLRLEKETTARLSDQALNQALNGHALRKVVGGSVQSLSTGTDTTPLCG